jgi:hypothetical protein
MKLLARVSPRRTEPEEGVFGSRLAMEPDAEKEYHTLYQDIGKGDRS